MDNVGVAAEKPIAFQATLARRHSNVATHAAIRRSDLAADDLPELNGKGIGLRRRQPRRNSLLNHAPVAEKVFLDRCAYEHYQRHQA